MTWNRIKVCKKKKGSSLFPETKVQIAIVKYIKLKYPFAKDHICMIGNEGKRTAQGHLLAKRMGMRKSASDLFIAWPTSEYYGLWLEIKKDGWKMLPSNKEHTESQLDFLEQMKNVGYQGKMCVGLDECIACVDEYFKPKSNKS